MDIPPPRSFIAWMVMHDKTPTCERLKERGCNIPLDHSTCFLIVHMLSNCGIGLHFNDVYEIWHTCDMRWSPQRKFVIKAAIVNLLATIWYARNTTRFKGKDIHWKSAISLISSNATLSGNNSQTFSNSSMTDFVIIKKFKVHIHLPGAPHIKEVSWQPPLRNWIKGNSNGYASSFSSACGIIFRNCDSDCLHCIFGNLGMVSAFHAELIGAMRAIETTYQRNWINFRLESDLILVVMKFSNDSLVSWQLRNKWFNCKKILSSMNFMVSHIFREGNQRTGRVIPYP